MKSKSDIILVGDPAHGINTQGKESPDGKHKEYLWSRGVLKLLKPAIESIGFTYLQPFTGIGEPGLTSRAVAYNQICAMHPEKSVFVFSPHNNASGISKEWRKANGNEIYTAPGFNQADLMAEEIGKELIRLQPTQRFRADKWSDGDLDKEAEFTVIAGNRHVKPLYYGILAEFGFMDNWSDYQRLIKPSYQKDVVECVSNGIGNYYHKIFKNG